MSKRYTICVDFDGVIHGYHMSWIAPHIIPDGPVPGAIKWLWDTLADFDIVIQSSRARTWRGRWAIRRWLKRHSLSNGYWYEQCGYSHGLEDIKITNKKPAALVYLDDRGMRFDGSNFPTAQQIHQHRPWNKQKVRNEP